ncbi:MAG: hypothetical protein ACTSWR_07905 [Candidatus Helarchaeota archaeon]
MITKIKNQYFLWRWAKINDHFELKTHWILENYKCVYAGLDPNQWNYISQLDNRYLHLIILTHDEAKACLVGECAGKDGNFTDDDIYEASLIPLTQYNDDYKEPEVLIQFPVNAICLKEES